MNVPRPKRNEPAEATQELQALDVLEIVETFRPNAGTLARKPFASSSSIAPVGLDLMPQRAVADEEANPTMEIRVPMARRHLGGVVIAAVAGCTVILLAAGMARMHPTRSAAAATGEPQATTAVATAPMTTPVAPPTLTPAAVAIPTPSDISSAGTVRLDYPASSGRVWLDGKKLSSSSALVSCGTHQIKVGRGRTHSIDVPCGGEIGVAK
jgi:hypothetical protein